MARYTKKGMAGWILALVIILIAAGLAIVFMLSQAAPRLQSEQEDIFASLTRIGLEIVTPEKLATGNVGNPANDVCFKGVFDIPLQNDKVGATCADKGSCTKVWSAVNTKVLGAAIALREHGVYAALGRKLCKYSAAGEDYCYDVSNKQNEYGTIAVSASREFTCGLFGKIGHTGTRKICTRPYLFWVECVTEKYGGEGVDESKTKGFCVRNSGGQLALTTQEFKYIPASDYVAVLGDKLYTFQRVSTSPNKINLVRYDLPKKGKKESSGEIVKKFQFSDANIIPHASANEKYLCYTLPTSADVECMTQLSNTISFTKGSGILPGQILGDDFAYAAKEGSSYNIYVANLAGGGETKVNSAPLGFEPGELIQSSRYVCFKEGSSPGQYDCISKVDSNKAVIKITGNYLAPNSAALDGPSLFVKFGDDLFNINLDKVAALPAKTLSTAGLTTKNEALACKRKIHSHSGDLRSLDSASEPGQVVWLG
jgi:hypothetical protein